MKKNIDKLNSLQYSDYRENLMNISRLTNKDNSILFNFNIDGEYCFNTVSVVEQSGDRSVLREVYFDYDEEFKNDFLNKFIVDFHDDRGVILTDTIDLDGDKLFTYRMITENNDLVTIDGITMEESKKIDDYIKHSNSTKHEKVYALTENTKGISNVWILLLIIIVLFLILLIFLFLNL